MVTQQTTRRAISARAAAGSVPNWASSATPPALTCARCGSTEVRPSGARDILAPLARRTGFRIYRCRYCHAGYFEEA
jgi:ribosomal protein L40E